jgi:hypothetical protein
MTRTPQLTEEQVREVARLSSFTRDELRVMARTHGKRTWGTKAQIINRIAGIPEPELEGPEPFVMPAEGVSREELTEAIHEEAENFRAKMQFARDFAVQLHVGGGGGSGRPCSGGTHDFMVQFGLPSYYNENGGASVRNAQVPLETDDFIPSHYTDSGLRHHLEVNVAKHAKKVGEMRNFAIQNRAYFPGNNLDEALAGIGAEPWAPGWTVSFNASTGFSMPRLEDESPTAAQQRIQQATQAFLKEIRGSGSLNTGYRDAINVTVTRE